MADAVLSQKANEKVKFWLGEIAAARKREKDWRREGRRIVDIYHGKKKDQIPFNILYSNTETLAPALYNSQPRPVVQRRFKDEDPMGKAAAQAGQRVLEFQVDTNSEEYQTFDDMMGDVVLDALLPGRGTGWVNYDAKIVGEGQQRYVEWELVCFESLKWDRWVFGFAKKWNRVPWVAREHDVTKEECEEKFGKKVADKLTFTEMDRSGDKEDDEAQDKDERTDEERKVAKVWELWHKSTKKVMFISPNYSEDYLKVDDDPLELTGFFPMPEPLRFLRKSNDLMPVGLYSLYENQAKELNRLSIRINRVAEAIKVRGAYDSTLTELGDLLKKDDNAMVPAENVAALQDGGLEKAIWLMPLDKLIVVLQQLYIARENCKKVIYEITGVSDILRGQSVASETATAQQIKNQWGTLRLKRLQRDVARYARDVLRISLEIAAKRFQEKTFASMTGLPFATTPEVQGAQAQVAAARSQIAMTGQQITPQLMTQVAPQAMQTLQKPQWQAVMKMLRDNTQRMYRIDIETNSTVDVEATEDQKLMGEVLQAVSQFIQGVSPLVISGSMPFQVAQSMLLAIVRRYRFGTEIEDYIKQMQPPTPPDQAKQAAEQQKQQAEAKMAQEQHQMDIQGKQMDLQMREKEMQMELAFKLKEHELKMAELAAKVEVTKVMAQVKLQEAQNKLIISREQAKIDVAKAHAMPEKKEGEHAAS